MSPRSRISQGKKIIQEALSPRHNNNNNNNKKKDFEFDPFSAAIEETRRKCYGGDEEVQDGGEEVEKKKKKKNRGRPGRRTSSSSSGFVRKGTRSLSPLRVSDVINELEAEHNSATTAMEKTKTSSSTSSSSSSSAYSSILQSAISFSKGYKKWKLKDLLLFRSASEGRATTSKDPLRKYTTVLSKKPFADDEEEDDDVVRNSSFRSTERESVGSVSSRRRGGGPVVSAHEIHYTVNRAVSEEMRKKTVLPYKHGLLGCLGNFNHPTGAAAAAGMQNISRSFPSFTRG